MASGPEEHTSSPQKRRSTLVNTENQKSMTWPLTCGSTSQTVSYFFRGNKPKRALVLHVWQFHHNASRKRMIRRRDIVARKLAAFDGSMKVTL
ncbi:hypothetical protein ASPFODRAFT_713837 [Aspergillus luchuensis CBS 106.47]|uniref:Uncharacterized protein n=1 Tax=Aspergillus luchuensis (strain CBS 106.47) TaxID=1137211 RepID=A0A1M3TQ89_ASPLC|nr:hypothetical protein ASPFODRAFT_713837 [Aspergillus luchuensis CBS 106.47]